MNQPNKQSLIAMIEAYAASKAEVALESNRPDQDCGYSLLQKEKKCVENKESLYNFIEKLNLDPTLSDIPIEELLAYVRNQLLSMAKDKTASAEIPNWEKSMALSASSIQEAIEQLNVVIGNPKIML
jgi:hypothetical protein